ncbi:flagellar hook-associated protein FlgK [Pararhizobium sp. O133]|uniref:flagellar hook-associated protein FlgK n=1 Tax=Pararhizobium sp. O133 TaxID=3449278 RepID=UPI003F68294E
MSLAAAISTAQTIFSNTGQQTAIVSKNIANSGNADYVRRLALMGIDSQGSYYIKIERAQNDALFKQNINNISATSSQSRLLDGLERMQSLFGGNDYPSSPSSYLATFQSSLQTFAASPSNITIASSTVADAKDLANSLKSSSETLQGLRGDADKEIQSQVSLLNEYLTKFETVNNDIVGSIATGKDASDALDQRDKLLKSISEIIGISTVTRSNADMVVYSSDGTVLFETIARKVTSTPKDNYSAADSGFPVLVDGRALKPGTDGNTTGQGTLSALLQIRDDVAPQMQFQLDEIARGLVKIFEQTTTTAGVTTTTTGLFMSSDDIGLTPADTALATEARATAANAGHIVGLASTLIVNPEAEQSPTKLRDGGFNSAPAAAGSGSAGFTDLLDSYITGMADPKVTFDPAAGLGSEGTIMTYASSSIGWLEQLRKSATTANENKSAMLSQTQQALSNLTGVSLDEELSLMLDLEQSYKASAKLLSTVDEMLRTLLDTVR